MSERANLRELMFEARVREKPLDSGDLANTFGTGTLCDVLGELLRERPPEVEVEAMLIQRTDVVRLERGDRWLILPTGLRRHQAVEPAPTAAAKVYEPCDCEIYQSCPKCRPAPDAVCDCPGKSPTYPDFRDNPHLPGCRFYVEGAKR